VTLNWKLVLCEKDCGEEKNVAVGESAAQGRALALLDGQPPTVIMKEVLMAIVAFIKEPLLVRELMQNKNAPGMVPAVGHLHIYATVIQALKG
jgi:hypothetical protein